MKRISKPCQTCPFEGSEPIHLHLSQLAEIQSYLVAGTNHLCHSDRRNQTICEGGRHFQLANWHKSGLISEPTDDALVSAMITAGVKPEPFQYGCK